MLFCILNPSITASHFSFIKKSVSEWSYGNAVVPTVITVPLKTEERAAIFFAKSDAIHDMNVCVVLDLNWKALARKHPESSACSNVKCVTS